MVEELTDILFALLYAALVLSFLMGAALLTVGIRARHLRICAIGGSMVAAAVVAFLLLVLLAVWLNDGSILATEPSSALER